MTARPRWRLPARLALAVASCLLAACAKFPATPSVGGERQLLDMRMTLRGPIDQNAYYLFVLDSNARDADGPEIIAPFTTFLGNGRATGAYNHYVEFHLGRFELFRDQPEQEGQIVPPREALGQPFFYDSTSSSGTLSCSIDLSTIRADPNDPNAEQLEINFITVNQIVLPGEVPIEPRQTDGFGKVGTSFLTLRVENGLTVDNTNGIEPSGETFEGNQLEAAYDLVDFQIRIRSGN